MNQGKINTIKTKPQSTGAIKKKKTVGVQTEISAIESLKADRFPNELKVVEVLELPDNIQCLKLNNNLSITIKVINDDLNDKFYGECPICIEPLGSKPLSSTICGHVFCTDCITNIVEASNRCPLCNKFLTDYYVHPIFLPLERVSF